MIYETVLIRGCAVVLLQAGHRFHLSKILSKSGSLVMYFTQHLLDVSTFSLLLCCTLNFNHVCSFCSIKEIALCCVKPLSRLIILSLFLDITV